MNCSPDPYHSLLHISLSNTSRPNQFKSTHSYHNFRKANYPQNSSFIASFDWQATFANSDLRTTVNLLIAALHTTILRFVPKINSRKSKFSSWISKELINLIRYKNKFHTIFKSSSDLLNYKVFSLTHAYHYSKIFVILNIYAICTLLT